jgi:DNA-binding IclR family transcriptional regulator
MIRLVDSILRVVTAPPRRSPDQGLQVLQRAAAVLDRVAAAPGQLRLADLGPLLELPKTTTHRIVTALEHEGLLRIDGDGRIWLGPRLQRWAGDARDQLVAQARPLLVELARTTGETADLSVQIGATAVFIDQVASNHRLRAVSAVGDAFALHTCANGKAMLATFDDDDAVRIAGSLDPLTDATISDPEALVAALEQVRSAGLAEDRGEHTSGICALGVAVVDASGQRIALSVPVPSERFGPSRTQISDALVRARRSLAELVGSPA